MLLLVASQVFPLKHMFPKALVLYFLCSDLLLLPCHMCEAQSRKTTKTPKLALLPPPQTSGLTDQIYYVE